MYLPVNCTRPCTQNTSHIFQLWHVALPVRDDVMVRSPSKSASRLPQPYQCPFSSSRDVVAKIKMKRISSPVDDNIPIYIFILLFAILLLSFLATDFKPRSTKPEQ